MVGAGTGGVVVGDMMTSRIGWGLSWEGKRDGGYDEQTGKSLGLITGRKGMAFGCGEGEEKEGGCRKGISDNILRNLVRCVATGFEGCGSGGGAVVAGGTVERT